MRYTTNLNIIIKAIDLISSRVARDFVELENLQTSPMSATKFANSCYVRIKEIIASDLTKIRPDYDLYFSDGEKISNNSEYSFVIYPIDGVNNLARSIPDFTIAIAIEHKNKDGKKETISVAINKIIGGELYYCEKGFGAYLNSRRLRVSKRGNNEIAVFSTEDHSELTKSVAEKLHLKNYSLRSYACRTLEIAYLAASRFDVALFKKWNCESLNPFTLLVKEAGGKIFEEEKFILATNGLIGF
jgi:myo-inositol-1(or 4)-monophosphatase